MNYPELILKDLEKEPNIGSCSHRGGRIMFYPIIKKNDFEVDKNSNYELTVKDGKSGKPIAYGTTQEDRQYLIYKKWINNIKLWLESHFEIWDKHGHRNMKFGFRIQDISKPIHLIFQIKVYFKNDYWGIWEKEFNGIIKIHKNKDWGEINQTDTILLNHNFEKSKVEPEKEKEQTNLLFEAIDNLIKLHKEVVKNLKKIKEYLEKKD